MSDNCDYVAGTTGNASLTTFTGAIGSKNVDHGVRGVAPPTTRTDRVLTLLRGRAERQLRDVARSPELTRHVPFGRLAESDAAADIAVFLASDRASHFSGVVVSLDHGQTARHWAE